MSGHSYNACVDVSREVEDALRDGRPVVALESTIICHGMPYPQNVETALAAEQRVRESGAVPATIAVLGGRLAIGINNSNINYLAGKPKKVIKCSRRDLPALVAAGLDGATTVAATMIVASMAGIRVFATGGIGGVHRDVERTMDVSADLEELARSDVAVVCAGIKSVLDIGRTLEYLETKGVPVIGYRTDNMPAFYARDSGFPVDYRLDTPAEIASLIKAKWDLQLGGGLVVANPIPSEHELDPLVIDASIEKALVEMGERGITGKDTTPFLLSKIAESTGGRSLEANIELVLHNAALAGRIASQFATLSCPG
jgi:pseudouridine-5'-phosphate glycosidase